MLNMFCIVSITPDYGHFGFMLKFNSDTIYFPGYNWKYQPDELQYDELWTILEEDFGCSSIQISRILYCITHRVDGNV